MLCPAGVVTGHQPHGDCPCVIRSGLVTVITADTSDDRGEKAVAEVLVYADGSSEVHGVLADGSNIAYTLAAGGRGDRFVGRQLSNGYWVKARTVGENPEYVLCLGEGFKLTVARKKQSEMEALADADFMQQVDRAASASAGSSSLSNGGSQQQAREAEGKVSAAEARSLFLKKEKADVEAATLAAARRQEEGDRKQQQADEKKKRDEAAKAAKKQAQEEMEMFRKEMKERREKRDWARNKKEESAEQAMENGGQGTASMNGGQGTESMPCMNAEAVEAVGPTPTDAIDSSACAQLEAYLDANDVGTLRTPSASSGSSSSSSPQSSASCSPAQVCRVLLNPPPFPSLSPMQLGAADERETGEEEEERAAAGEEELCRHQAPLADQTPPSPDQTKEEEEEEEEERAAAAAAAVKELKAGAFACGTEGSEEEESGEKFCASVAVS